MIAFTIVLSGSAAVGQACEGLKNLKIMKEFVLGFVGKVKQRIQCDCPLALRKHPDCDA